jgi:uncharacterized membrane protein YhaH (DUF805 family)
LTDQQNQREMRALVMGLFGLSVVASGCWRFFSAAGGVTGLSFGLVMGMLAFLSAWCFHTARIRAAQISAWTSILLVAGWFGYESLVKNGLRQAEPRQLLIIGITLMTLLLILFFTWSRSRGKSGIPAGDEQFD